MDSFLKHIALQYKVDHRDSLKEKCFVFPSRRASLYFEEILRTLNKDIPFWAPSTFSIEEFVQTHNPDLLLADNIQLILKLYRVYKKNGGTEKFDEFYSWGSILLNDFDQIDRYLIDGNKVYKNLQDVDDLEATFGPSEELVRALKSFKTVIDDGKDGRLTSSFTDNWALVGKMYQQFKAEMIASGTGYMGMLYQNLADKLLSDKIELPYQQIVFAGFNALSKSEDKIINKLMEVGKAKVFFDADKYYLNDDKEEAGNFLRKNKRRWYKNPAVEWVISDGFKAQKKIEIIGIEQQVAQTRAASEIINEYGVESTAIVLGDESLISPMLFALPDTIGDINITMGYPVAGSSLANLSRAYFKYQDLITKSKQVFLHREALITLFTQPALSPYISSEFNRLKTGKSTYIGLQAVEDLFHNLQAEHKELILPLFRPQESVIESIDVLIEYLSIEYYKERVEESILSNGIRYSVLKHLKDLKTELIASSMELSYNILDKILRESLKQLSTPFSGEPLAQLQVMGFLESRALDFKNLILLSVNEDTIPASSGTNSYIPFNIRKAFGLPTFLDQNSIYAYHFFRLLQRAEKVSLIYSSQLSITGAGEQSRFIYQLIERSKSTKSAINITRKFWTPAVPDVSLENQALVITKNNKVMNEVIEHLNGFQNNRTLSPTQLTDYITCSLKYYYARVLKIREEDKESEKIDARTFGNLLHELLELCYTPWINKKVSADEIKNIIKSLPKLAVEVFQEYDSKNGETRFTQELILKLAEYILKNDIKDAPVFIHDLESKTERLSAELSINDSLKINIGGLVDRLDSKMVDRQEVHRILDYKTGRTELRSINQNRKPMSDEDYVAAHFSDPKYKSGFQLLFYVSVLKLMNPSWKLNAGIIGVRKVNSGIDYLRNTEEPISDMIISLYEEKLKKLILEIANPEIPFTQTDDLKRCEYCQFKRICNR